MSKVITLSQTFPKYHPQAGHPTDFVQKVWMSLIASGHISMSKCVELSREIGIGNMDLDAVRTYSLLPKHHTIRGGRRWKDGDLASLRVWSARPYNSPQIIIAPDVPVKVFNFEIDHGTGVMSINGAYTFCYQGMEEGDDELLAENDGLTYYELQQWFRPAYMKEQFVGQIICWNPTIEYKLI